MFYITRVGQGDSQTGCRPSGVYIQFKESTTKTGRNKDRLRRLLEGRGYLTQEGVKMPDVPFFRLCVWVEGRQVSWKEILAVLEADPDINTEGVYRPQGSALEG